MKGVMLDQESQFIVRICNFFFWSLENHFEEFRETYTFCNLEGAGNCGIVPSFPYGILIRLS